jgi:hypothetical protein
MPKGAHSYMRQWHRATLLAGFLRSSDQDWLMNITLQKYLVC